MSEHAEYLEPVASNDVDPLKSLAPIRFGSRQERFAILAGIVFQVLVLVGMIAGNVVPYVGARTILLRVQPVDPRDLLRGDYVILSYEISRSTSNTQAGGIGGESANRTVYVSLTPEPDGRHYRSAGVSPTRPATGLYIRGTVTGWNQIKFGIESYYVEEGKGHDYERAVLERRLSAEVALSQNGDANLQRLIIE